MGRMEERNENGVAAETGSGAGAERGAEAAAGRDGAVVTGILPFPTHY
jgi:hypothetical protein